MACRNCGQSAKQPCKDCGCVGQTTIPCNNNPFLPVETLPNVEDASRRYIYLLPSNQYFGLNYDGDGFNELKNGGVFSGDYYEIGDLLDFNSQITGSKWKTVYQNDVVQKLIIDFDVTCPTPPVELPLNFTFNCPNLMSELEALGYIFDTSTIMYLVKEMSFPLVVKANGTTSLELAHVPLFINGETVMIQIANINNFVAPSTGSVNLVGQFVFEFVGKINRGDSDGSDS